MLHMLQDVHDLTCGFIPGTVIPWRAIYPALATTHGINMVWRVSVADTPFLHFCAPFACLLPARTHTHTYSASWLLLPVLMARCGCWMC